MRGGTGCASLAHLELYDASVIPTVGNRGRRVTRKSVLFINYTLK